MDRTPARLSKTLYEGVSVRLSAVAPDDYVKLFEWRCADGLHYLSMNSGTTTLIEFSHWLDNLRSRNVVILVSKKDSNEAIGYILTYVVDLWNGWAYWAQYVAPEFRRGRHMVEALAATATILFEQLPMRKLYVEIYEPAKRLAQHLEALGYVEEGFVPSHSLVTGKPIGVWTYALYRERWESNARRELRRLNFSPYPKSHLRSLVNGSRNDC